MHHSSVVPYPEDMSNKSKTKKKPLPKHEEELTEDERDPKFLEAPPKAPPVPGVAPSEAPQVEEETEVEPKK